MWGGGEGCVGGETTHCKEMLQKMRIWRPESGAKSSGRTDVFSFFSSSCRRTDLQVKLCNRTWCSTLVLRLLPDFSELICS